MTNKKFYPTEAELEVLQVLWAEGPSSVRLVNNILNESRDVGYTTTLKIMQIMTEKGLVTRDTTNRTHIYHSAVAESDTQNSLLSNFIQKAYKGSAMRLVIQALGQQKATPEELNELKQLIENMDNPDLNQ